MTLVNSAWFSPKTAALQQDHDAPFRKAPRGVGAQEVEDVLGHGKAKTDHGAVDDAVQNVVELVAEGQQQDEQRRTLDGLFHDRCDQAKPHHLGQRIR